MSNLIGYPGHKIILEDIVRAENCSLFDAQNNRYVDLESGVWCTTIGHGHPRVVRVLQEQAARIAHAGYCYSSEVVQSAAAEVLAVLGFEGGRGVFLCSGSEAIEFGVRSIQQGNPRPRLMTMTDSYFGAYGSACRKSESEWFLYDWQGCRDCPANDDGSRDCEHWNAIPFDQLGGFLLEPGSSSGFVRFPPEDMVRAIVTRIRGDGGLYMVNEVTTGFGRTGAWFGHQHYGIRPDVAALGKSMGNGYPVSFAAFAPGVLEHLTEDPLHYAQSHQNDPLGAAVAREVVRVIRDENLIERARESAAILTAGLREIEARVPTVAAIRSRGMMFAVDLGGHSANAFAQDVQEELVRQGFILARRSGASTLRIDPALTIEHRDLRGFLECFGRVLTSASRRERP